MSVFDIYDVQNKKFDLSHGFLPATVPLQELPSVFKSWEQLAIALPKFLLTDQIRQYIEDLPYFPVENLTSREEYERAMLILSYLGHAYVWGQKEIVHVLPENLSQAWYSVAKKIGRPPVLSYASYALYNWKLIDSNHPIELGNIALLQNFLSGLDEEWFILVHIDIERKAIPALQSLIKLKQAVSEKKLDIIIEDLKIVDEALTQMCHSLERMTEHCDPYIYYNRVRPYIHGWKDNPALPNGLIYQGVKYWNGKPQKFKGETGAQSSIIPSLDAVFCVTHEDSPLVQHLQEMRAYMPPAHRQFVSYLENGPSLREYIVNNHKTKPLLKELYNSILEKIYHFRHTHVGYAAHYIQKQHQTSKGNPTQIGTGGTPFMTYLRQHLGETKQFLID